MQRIKTTTTTLPKYKIDELLGKLPNQQYLSALTVIPTILNVHRNSFYRWRKITIDSSYEVPVKHLQSLAKLFNCTIEDLLSEECNTPSLDQALEIYKTTSIKNSRALVR